MTGTMDWFDDDVLMAAADLVGRSGATDFQIGYLHDDVPVEQAAWYAHAQYRGARITSQDHPNPIAAAEGLAHKLLAGAQCAHCGGLVALSDFGAPYTGATRTDGSKFTLEQARSRKQCRWRRMGPKWVRGCEHTGPPKAKKAKKKGRKR